jgi:murein DD-endopeptidase MepM/ murein hydrolase activator NlpD
MLRICGFTCLLVGWCVALTLTATRAGATSPSVSFSQPVMPACISSPFGWRHAVGPHAPAGLHNGVDLPAPAGAAVRAVAAGQIAAIHRRGPGGLSVLVRHADGRTTVYAHLGALSARLASGARDVVAGEQLGRVGRSGITYGTHLFFAVFERNQPIDPEPLLGAPRCGRLASD